MVKNAMNGNGKKKTSSQRVKTDNEGMSPAIGAVVGAAAGAVVGSVIVHLMGDAQNRKKAGQLLNKSMDVLKEINEQPQGIQSLADESITSAVTKTRKF